MNVRKRLSSLRVALKPVTSFPYILIIFGLTGLAAALAFAAEKEHLLKNPGIELACNLNPVYSCSNVFLSPQAQIVGVSNEYFGIAIFGALITVGVVILAGATMKKWFWQLFILGMIGAMAVVFWFFYQSVYVIGSLCIFCSIVWLSTWTITVAGFSWMYDTKLLPTSAVPQRIFKVIREYNVLIWFLLLFLFATLIVKHFWYYYGQYF
jgi:uncharacterized membrane protein